MTTCQGIIIHGVTFKSNQCFKKNAASYLQEIKERATVTSRRRPEVLSGLFREGGKRCKQLGHVSKKSKPENIQYFSQISFHFSLYVLSLPENVLVLDIARRQWGRALPIEQAWQGVGQRDEEGENVDLHEGRVRRLSLHQR